ncbi:hypothetical protein [Mesorhizobium sp. M9A.F.Ca.ET.002.03.1.2]|uniref:hypothetical protein n=1 Tax=Mesorhizobium sp. M9A.F.Ca.ET.002.03.1.2 TaxID=2493668 RepID=UPI001FDF7C2F|nr:hypothetical protein [Mesorhizobium sp. M9A.F.Ca.ET.002.03.1.2]
MLCSRIRAAPTAMSRMITGAGTARIMAGRAFMPSMSSGADGSGFGDPRLPCATCHFSSNSNALHGPPSAENWRLTLGETAWLGKSSAKIWVQIKDPVRDGGRSLQHVALHVRNDRLVGWGWAPRSDRGPAPARPKRPIRRLKTGWWRAHLVQACNDPATFLTILRCNFDVEARFADHGKLNAALRAPISATRPS